MLLNFLLPLVFYFCCVQTDTIDYLEFLEDEWVMNETIAKYGFPINITELNLPGPELSTEEFSNDNGVEQKEPGTYTLKIRTKTANFSYNGRFEESVLKRINGTEIPTVKGQFGEHFVRASGGYYIRTIGYLLDEKGYRQFLIGLSIAKTVIEEYDLLSLLVGSDLKKIKIAQTVLETLIGGNTIG